jgi:hypothetical protein
LVETGLLSLGTVIEPRIITRILVRFMGLVVFLAACDRPHDSDGERLARTHCATCHAFPEPHLLDKQTWQRGVLPQMAERLGVGTKSLFDEAQRGPQASASQTSLSESDWAKIVAYYRDRAPDTLPRQALPAQPALDPNSFSAGPLVPRMQSSGIITLLQADSAHELVWVGEAGTNTLRAIDWQRRTRSSLTLASPPTGLVVDVQRVLVLESGALEPNDQPHGSLVQYELGTDDSLRLGKVLVDSLLRPVFVRPFDFDGDHVDEFVICEFGNNRGRLALYRYDGAKYERRVLESTPGAIRVEIRDMTGDGAPDIVALFAQADERIVLFENDGRGNFSGRHRILARFPPVYGSMYFAMHDFNRDGRPDIIYVNGDNFDYSRVPKPYHGIRILENDGKNNFRERYFFPMYGAAQAAVADFDHDGDLDIVATSNFADPAHSERGIMFLENAGAYVFRPSAFSAASKNQWNVMATADVNKDGWLDVIVGAMNLSSIAGIQQRFGQSTSTNGNGPLLLFENRMQSASRPGAR